MSFLKTDIVALHIEEIVTIFSVDNKGTTYDVISYILVPSMINLVLNMSC